MDDANNNDGTTKQIFDREQADVAHHMSSLCTLRTKSSSMSVGIVGGTPMESYTHSA